MSNEEDAKKAPMLTAQSIIENLKKEVDVLNEKRKASEKAIGLNTRRSKALMQQYDAMIKAPQLCEAESEFQKDPTYWEAVKEMLILKKDEEIWNLETFTKQNERILKTLDEQIVEMNKQIQEQEEKLKNGGN